jgi:hypothetical protein
MACMEPLTFIWPGESPGTTVRPAREPEEIESRADLLLIDSRVEALWSARLPWNKPRVVIPGGKPARPMKTL